MVIDVECLKEILISNVSVGRYSVKIMANSKDLMGDYAIQRAMDKLIDSNPGLELVAFTRYTNLFGVPEALVVFREKKKSFWEKIFSKK